MEPPECAEPDVDHHLEDAGQYLTGSHVPAGAGNASGGKAESAKAGVSVPQCMHVIAIINMRHNNPIILYFYL